MLGKRAANVVGVDRSRAAVAAASARYASANVRFEVGDAVDLSGFGDGAFDAVVSFETLEHIRDYRAAVAEFVRVLAADGRLILSSPNHEARRNVFTRSPNNPYHTQEFTLGELRALFPGWTLEVFGQGTPEKPGPLKPFIDLLLALDVFRLRRLLVRHASFMRKVMFKSFSAEISPIEVNPQPMFFVIIARRGESTAG